MLKRPLKDYGYSLLVVVGVVGSSPTRGELEPVRDKAGTPLPHPPNDKRAKLVREELKGLLEKATKMVILVGETTHKSQWVNWEIRTFFDKKKKYPGKTKARLMAMKLKG